MKITDLKSAIIGNNICLRVKTDKGIDGYSQVEENKDFINVNVPYFRDMIVGCDPTNVEDVMRRIRRLGAFKPWGKLVSSIEMALWDIAGKEAGVPVYKLLGGKVRDRVRVYCTQYSQEKLPYPDPESLISPAPKGLISVIVPWVLNLATILDKSFMGLFFKIYNKVIDNHIWLLH